MRRLLRIAPVSPLLVLAVLACQGAGDLPLDQADPDAVPQDPTYPQVFAILHRACVPCHHNGGGDVPRTRAAAGDPEPDLEDCNEIVAHRHSILEQVESNRMPPGAWPRLTSEEKLIIRRWIDDGAPAPCN